MKLVKNSLQKALSLSVLVLSTFFAPTYQTHAVEVQFEEDRSVPTVHLILAFRNGAAADPDAKSGLGHFTLSMMTRGTESRSKAAFDLELDTLGASLETELRSEFLLIRGSCLTSQLPRFLRLVEDLVLHPKFSEAEIRKLKAETLSALAEEKGRDAPIASKLFTEFLFTDGAGKVHAYGRNIAGKAREVARFTRGDLVEHHRQLLTADRLVVIGSGDYWTAKVEDWSNRLASKLPPKSSLPAALSPPPRHTGRDLLLIDKPDRTQGVVIAAQPGILMTDPEYPALSVANQAFGDSGFNSRLMTEIRVKRGWSYGAHSFFKFGTRPRAWSLSFQPAEKDLIHSLAYLDTLLKEVRAQGITEAEFEIAKTSLINGAGFLYNTPAKRMENTVLEKMLGLKPGFFKDYVHQIEPLTRAQVNLAFQKFLDLDHMTFGVLATLKPGSEETYAKALGVPSNRVTRKDYRTE